MTGPIGPREGTVPRIKPAPDQQMTAFQSRLPARLRGAFRKLAALIKRPVQDLDWYHDVGRLTRELRQPGEPGSCMRLAAALGPGLWFFRKAAHFVRLYPTKPELDELKKIGAVWTWVYLSFPVHDRKKRHALLREAVEERWTIPHFRYVLQERGLAPQPGVGGRKRRTPDRWGPRVCLRRMRGLIQAVLDFHAETWTHVTAAQWRKFARDCDGPEREALLELLKSAEGITADLADAGRDMHKKLTELRTRALDG